MRLTKTPLDEDLRFAGRPPRYVRWQRHWEDLLVVLRALEGLVAAEFPLVEGLKELSYDAPRHGQRYVLYWLAHDIEEGASISQAVGSQSYFFPPIAVDLVRAGEESGKLKSALTSLANEIERGLALRLRVAYVGSYLVWILIVESVLIVGLASSAAPLLVEIIQEFGLREDPSLAYWAAMENQWGMVLAVTALPVCWVMMQRSKLTGGFLHSTAMATSSLLPGVRRWHRKRHLADACTILGLLTGAGIPLHRALRSAAEANLYRPCRVLLGYLADEVEGGTSLTDALARPGLDAPSSFRNLLRLADSSGEVPAAFSQLAELYELQLQRRGHLLIEFGAPLCLIGIGFIVFFFYSRLFFTLLELTNLGFIYPVG